MPPTPPPYGQGPANFAGQPMGPFAPFNNQIDYQAMMRYQMVAQYQQQQPTQYNLPQQMQRQVLTDPRYSYGVQGGLDPSYYNRQASLNRTAYAGAITTGALSSAAWSAVAAPLAAAGFAGSSVFLPAMALTAPITNMIAGRVDQNLTRQKYMHSIAMDLQQNRDRLGMSGLTYNQATAGGAMAAGMMLDDKGKFFSKEQMMRIHKIGLSEGMLNQSGSVSRYTRNLKDLIDSTEEIVKALQTTIEGGMSIIKEVNQIGFKTLPQVRSAIRMAKAGGTATGIGMQNMLQIGAAGAQAVQGTPWTAATGASMFQMGAVNAAAIANASSAGARAVERAGGVGQAGAGIASFQMNVLQSGIGTRMAAYAANPDLTVNQGRLRNLLSGNVSGYQIVSGANQAGYAMGANRVRFDMFKEDLLNQMSDQDRARAAKVAFNEWRRGRGGGGLNQAAVWAKMFTNDPVSRRLAYESLIGPSGLMNLEAVASAQRFSSADMMEPPWQSGPIIRALGAAGRGVRRGVYGATDFTMEAITAAGAGVSDWWSYVAGAPRGLVNLGYRALGGDRRGIWRRPINYGNTEQLAMSLTGANPLTNPTESLRQLSLITNGFRDFSTINPVGRIDTGLNLNRIMNQDPRVIQFTLSRLHSLAQSTDIAGDLKKYVGLQQALQTEDLSKLHTRAGVVSAIDAISGRVKQDQNQAMQFEKNIRKDVLNSPVFQTELINANRYLRTRDSKTTLTEAVTEYEGMISGQALPEGLSIFDRSRAVALAEKRIRSQGLAGVQTMEPLRFDVEGMRQKAIERYLTPGPYSDRLGMLSNIYRWGSAGGRDEFWTKMYKNRINRKEGAELRKNLALYKSAKAKLDSGEDPSPEESKAYRKYYQDKDFQDVIAASDKASALDLANRGYIASDIAKRIAKARGIALSEVFTPQEYLGALEKAEKMGGFIDKYAKFFDQESDIMREQVLTPGQKTTLAQKQQKFLSYTIGAAKEQKPTIGTVHASLAAELETLEKRRKAITTGVDEFGKEVKFANNEEKQQELQRLRDDREAVAAKRAELGTEMMLQMMGQGKSGNTASVSSPILNYWNNRWVL